MSRDETIAASNSAANRRRSSFTANKLSEMFGSARNPNANGNSSPGNSPPPKSSAVFPTPSVTAAARRLSINGNIGLPSSGNSSAYGSTPNSATGNGPGNAWNLRRGSLSASTSTNASEESAIDETGESTGPPPSHFGRRMSSGARAMGQMRGNEGFNWADNIRNRQSRSGSLGGSIMSANATRNEQMQTQQDKMQQPPRNAPPAPAPAAMKKERPAPDHFQERILKGDFYMD